MEYNHIKSEIQEVVKEYETFISTDIKLKSKITRFLNVTNGEMYFINYSHWCKQSKDAATVYVPSGTYNNFKSAEQMMVAYIESFTEIDVEVNRNY